MKRLSVAAAGVMAVILAVSFSLLSVSPAKAASVGDITEQNVTLTINKYQGEIGDTSTTFPSVSFKATRLNLVNGKTGAAEMKDIQAWEEVQALITGLQGGTPVPDERLNTTYTFTKQTNSNGVATFSTTTDSTFTVGAYLIEEVGDTTNQGWSRVAPFIVTLPYTDTNGVWSYSLTANPKNQSLKPKKTVDTSLAAGQNKLVYTIEAPIPADPKLNKYVISDTLQETIAYESTPASTVLIRRDAPASSGTATPTATASAPEDITLVASTDYTLTTGTTITVTLTDAGIAKLVAAKAGNNTAKVLFTFAASIKPAGTGGPSGRTIENNARVTTHTGTNETDDTAETDDNTDVETDFAKSLTITKTGDSNDDATFDKFNGAVFEVYKCQENAGKWEKVGTALSLGNANTATSGTSLFTTAGGTGSGATGTKSSVTAWGNFAVDSTYQYCVLEVTAPNGYLASTELHKADISGDSTNGYTISVTVQNLKQAGILDNLPHTGAAGVAAFFVLGLALVARGIYVSRKRRTS